MDTLLVNKRTAYEDREQFGGHTEMNLRKMD
jgi:hypothetical protein